VGKTVAVELKNDVVFTGENEISFEDGSASLQPA